MCYNSNQCGESMKVIKEKSENGMKIFLQEGDKYLAITFGGNGDLYWTIHNEADILDADYNHDSFIITKENYEIYRLFELLFLDIENINVFVEDVPFYSDDEDMVRAYIKRRQQQIEEYKKFYRLYNMSHYNDLFDRKRKTITWYSDETFHKVANFVTIHKEEDTFRIDFYIQPHISDYDKDFNSIGYIPIRFRNVSSSYDPFNVVFMKMYHALKEVDDVLDIGHQMDIEELLYRREKVKKLLP